MTTTTVTSNPASALYAALNGSSSTPSTATTGTDTQNRFLKLLTAQLKNQDPLNPMDNSQMTSQMAQISTVEGIQQLNTTLQSLITDSANSQAVQAASLVGKGVLVPGNAMALQGGSAYGGIDVANAADAVSVNIIDSNGQLVRTLSLGSQTAGSHTFSWDGTTNGGVVAADGNYTFSVTANQGGNSVTTTPLALGLVSSVTRNGTSFSLNVGQQTFSLADVRQIL